MITRIVVHKRILKILESSDLSEVSGWRQNVKLILDPQVKMASYWACG